MTRLAIIDPAGGRQPVEVGGWHVVMNGEIYNYRDLRRELLARGQVFRTMSDTEVVAAGLSEWGLDAFARLDGMFAIAAFNDGDQSLSLARDRFGEKPLYFHETPTRLVFASEPRVFHSLGPLPSLSDDAVAEFLRFGWVRGEQSIWQGIRRVSPGTVVSVSSDRMLSVYPIPYSPAPFEPADDLVSALDSRLASAVRSRLVADVDVGVLLSGGIDSSLVARYAAAEVPRIKTFTIKIEGDSRDESAYAREVAHRVGSEHHEISIGGGEIPSLAADLPRVFDEPFADSSALPMLLVSQAAALHVKAALGGDGGDEIFSGYPRYGILGQQGDRGFPKRLVQNAARSASWAWWARPNAAFRRVGDAGRPVASRYVDSVSMIPEGLLGRLAIRQPSDVLDSINRCSGDDGNRWQERWDLSNYLPDDLLVKIDRASMARGLEVRAPFLEPRLVEWALGIPSDRVGEPGGKALPRELMLRHFGSELAARPKQGFSVPVAAWMRGPLRAMADAACDGYLVANGYVDGAAVRKMRRALDRRFDRVARPLWVLATFELWHERWMGGAPSRPGCEEAGGS